MSKIELNPLTDVPNSLTPITKKFMVGYIVGKGTEEDLKWFKRFCNSHVIKKKNNLTGKMIDAVDIKAVRHEFAKRYFPYLLNTQKVSKSFLDLVNEL